MTVVHGTIQMYVAGLRETTQWPASTRFYDSAGNPITHAEKRAQVLEAALDAELADLRRDLLPHLLDAVADSA
jgi:hypothetical protein